MMKIGELATRSGVRAKTIRYYESIGVLPEPARAANGYRYYDERSVNELRFVHRARDLGFPMDEVRTLLALWRDSGRQSREVKRLVQRHLVDVEAKIAALESIRATLRHLAESCHGDERPDCPIIQDLAKGSDS